MKSTLLGSMSDVHEIQRKLNHTEPSVTFLWCLVGPSNFPTNTMAQREKETEKRAEREREKTV